MLMKLKILFVLSMIIICGCVSPEVRQTRQAEKARLEEQRIAEEARLEEQHQAEKVEEVLAVLDRYYQTPDKALMFLGEPTKRATGDKIFILQYEWSECACDAILSYDKKTKILVDWNITPCVFHGWKKFGFPDMD